MIPIGFLRANARWLAGGILLMFCSSFGQTFFIGLFAGEIRADFGLSHGGFGAIYMAGTVASAATMIWLGSAVDRYPPAKIATIIMAGLAGTCLVMAIAGNWIVLLAVIFGLRLFGQGMMTQIAMTATGRWFAANRGRAVAISALGYDLGVAIFPATVVILMAIAGWRQTWALAAIFLLILALPLLRYLFATERTPASSPEDQQSRYRPARDWSRAEVLADPAFWTINLGMLGPPFIGTAIMFHQIHLVESKGWALGLFAAAYPLYAGTTVIMALVCGWAIDRFGAARLLPTFLISLAAGLAVLSGVQSWIAIPVFMILYGINSAFMSTLNGALWPEIYGTRNLGAIRSVVVALMVFSSALGPGFVGWLIDRSVSLDVQFIAMGIYCAAVSVVLYFVGRHVRARTELAPIAV